MTSSPTSSGGGCHLKEKDATVAENFQACSELRGNIKKEFDKNNIKIAGIVSDITIHEQQINQ